MKLPHVLLAVAVLYVPTLSANEVSEARPEDYEEFVVARDVMVPMRDGVRLATDIYRPSRNGVPVSEPLPTLLSRSPYGKEGAEKGASFLAKRGYAVVVQDVRGRFDSEGTFYIYVNEGRDGFDAVAWVASQSWSTGDVATFGGSYLAATQHALAAESPPALRGMFVQVSTSNYWEDGAGAGGAFALLHNLVYALNLASTSKEATEEPELATALRKAVQGEALESWLRAYPYRPNASPIVVPTYQKWFQDWVDHSSFGEYWSQNGYLFELYYESYPDVPVYHVGGWYDIFLRGTLNNHAGLDAENESPARLTIGPWEHGVGPRATGDVDFGPTAEVDFEHVRLEFFDHIFHNTAVAATEGPPVRLFVMGGGDGTKSPDGYLNHGGEWLFVDEWPPASASPQKYFLNAGGVLSTSPEGGASEPSQYRYDPNDPVPSIGGKINSGDELVPSGPFNQRCIEGRVTGCRNNLPLSSRRDVLTFQTAPLEEDVVIAGELSVTLWVASSAKDTDFTAKLVDIYPPSEDYPEGYDLLIADRIQRARYRNGLDKEELLVPGEIHELTIDLLGVANRFQKGHRIRLDIASSNFPFFDVNPNTGERLGHHTHTVIATNSIYHDADHPSHIVLPLFSMEASTDGPQ